MIDIDEKIYEEFENKFGGNFCQINSLILYKDKKGILYILKDDSEKMVKKSLKDNINYLLSNKIFVSDPELFY